MNACKDGVPNGRLVGLTGGAGSGKTEAAKRFEAHGLPVIYADRVGHELLAPGGEAVEAIAAVFGDVASPDRGIDRRKVGALVFADERALARLNAITHPLIYRNIARKARELGRQGERLIIVDAALIGEDGVRPKCLWGLILIDTPREERVRRLMASRGWTHDEAARRIDAQTPPETKRVLADWVLENTGPLEAFHHAVDALAHELMHGSAQEREE